MTKKDRIGIGVIGAGFLAETRARCYAQVSGIDVEIVGVAGRTESNVRDYAERHDIGRVFTDYHELLALPEVDLVDLCVPNLLHRPMAVAAAAAGKHVVCTKPLTAYVGQDLPEQASDHDVATRDRRIMLEVASADAAAMVAAARRHGVQLMYGENWVYAPSVTRAIELIETSKGTVMEMRGGECHSGSHSPYSKTWRYTGGGALLRMGSHPIGAMLHVKAREGIARDGVPIVPVSVTAEVGDLSRIASVAKTRAWVTTGWQDVENWSALIVTFSDGARAVVNASDTVLGGMESKLEILATNCHIKCNMSPNDLVVAYAPDPDVFQGEYLMEKLDTRAGWSTPIPNEDWSSGHLAMCQDFVEAAAADRPAASDGELGRQVVRVLYTAYVAAAEARRVELE